MGPDPILLPPPPTPAAPPSVNSTADTTLGVVLILCMMIGIPANLLSFYYFSHIANRTVHNMLYMIVTITDTLTLATAFGPVSVLVSDTDRSPMVYGDPRISIAWTVVFYFTVRYSLFTVMVISISRTISMKAPFYMINQRAVVWSCLIYALWLAGKDVFFILIGAVDPEHYDKLFASSIYYYNSDNALGVMFLAFGTQEIALVTLVNFVTFIVSTAFLKFRKPAIAKRGRGERFRSVSVTITIFMAVSLSCTIPLIIILFLQLFGVYEKMSDMTLSYARFVCHVFLVMVNASVNPTVYISRMPAYRKWFGVGSRRVRGSLTKSLSGRFRFSSRLNGKKDDGL